MKKTQKLNLVDGGVVALGLVMLGLIAGYFYLVLL